MEEAVINSTNEEERRIFPITLLDRRFFLLKFDAFDSDESTR